MRGQGASRRDRSRDFGNSRDVATKRNGTLSDARSVCISKEPLTRDCFLKNPLIFASFAVCSSFSFFLFRNSDPLGFLFSDIIFFKYRYTLYALYLPFARFIYNETINYL